MNTKKALVLALALMLVLPVVLGMYDGKALAADINVKVTPVGETQLDVSWDPYPGAVMYAVYFTTVKDSYRTYTMTYEPFISHTNREKNTQYWYRVVPNNKPSVSFVGTGTTGQATTAPTPSPVETPSIPTDVPKAGNPELNEDLNLEIEILNYTELRLTWDLLDDYEEYHVWRYGDSGYELMDTVESNKWDDEGLDPGTAYQYMVSTSDNAYYMEASGTTMSYPGAGCDYEYPVIKIWQRSVSGGTRLTWNDVGADEYYVLRSEVQDSFDWIDNRIATIPAGQALNYLDTDTSRQYYYLIVANIKTCSEFVDYALDLTVSNNPASPYSSLILNWTDSSNAGSYQVFRSTNGSNWVSRTTTNGLSFTDTGLTAGMTYYYKVVASNGLEDIESGTTRKQDVLTLTVTNNTADPYTRLNLSWTDTSNAASYTVQRSTNNYNWSNIGTATSRSYVDTGLNPGTTYYYKVIANTGIEGTNSGKTKPRVNLNVYVTTVSSSQLMVTWTGVAGETAYQLERSLYQNGPYTIIAANIKTTSYLNSGLKADTVYWYRVTSSPNKATGTNWGRTAKVTTPTPTPTPTALPKITNQKAWNMHCEHYRVFAKWDAMPGAVKYEIQYQRSAMQTGAQYSAWAPFAYPTSAPSKPYGSYSLYISNGYFYTFRIRYQVADGRWSDWSIMGPTSIIPGYCASCRRVY